jgi:hypothetical protein
MEFLNSLSFGHNLQIDAFGREVQVGGRGVGGKPCQLERERRMSAGDQFKKGWPFIALMCGFVVVFGTWPTYRHARALAPPNGVNTVGVVTEWETFVKSGGSQAGRRTYYRIEYDYTVDGRIHLDEYECHCSELRRLEPGDSIPVRHSRNDPSINLPAGIDHNANAEGVVVLVGGVVLLAGLIGTVTRLGG